MIDGKSFIDAAIGDAGGCVVDVINVPVRAEQIALRQRAARILQGAAINTEHSAGLRHDRPAGAGGKIDTAANGREFPDLMAHIGEVAGNLQQPAFRIVAVGGVGGTGRHQAQLPRIHIDGVAAQQFGEPVLRIVPQFEALNVHREVVGGHCHRHGIAAGDIDQRAAIGLHAIDGGDGDLPAWR